MESDPLRAKAAERSEIVMNPAPLLPFVVPSRRMRLLLLGGMAIGLAAFLSSLFMSPQKGWTSLLLGSYLILCLGLAGVFILALFYAVSAEWAASLRRVPEAMAAVLPYGAIGLAITFAAYPSLYPWVAGSIHGIEITGFKKLWLNFPFFLVRAGIYEIGRAHV